VHVGAQCGGSRQGWILGVLCVPVESRSRCVSRCDFATPVLIRHVLIDFFATTTTSILCVLPLLLPLAHVQTSVLCLLLLESLLNPFHSFGQRETETEAETDDDDDDDAMIM